MGLRWKADYRAFQVEVTHSFSDRKTLGQRREEVREPASPVAAQGGQKEPRFLSEGRAHTRALRVGRAPIQGAEWRGVTEWRKTS